MGSGPPRTDPDRPTAGAPRGSGAPDGRGTVDIALDEKGVRKAAARLRSLGVTSIAVVFLYSYLNPVHELRASDIILDEFPDLELLSLSHEVYPKPPEFERISTTLVNAYVGPPIVRYVDRLEEALSSAGFGRESCSPRAPGGSPRLRTSGQDRSSR